MCVCVSVGEVYFIRQQKERTFFIERIFKLNMDAVPRVRGSFPSKPTNLISQLSQTGKVTMKGWLVIDRERMWHTWKVGYAFPLQ